MYDEKVQELELYDINGKLILNVSMDHEVSNYIMDTKAFANGIYFIRLKTDKQIHMQKLAIYK